MENCLMARLSLLSLLLLIIGCAGSIRWLDRPIITNREMIEKLIQSRIYAVLDSIAPFHTDMVIRPVSIHSYNYLVNHYFNHYFLQKHMVSLIMDTTVSHRQRLEYSIETLGISLEKLNSAYLFQTQFFSRTAELILACNYIDSLNQLQSSFRVQGMVIDTLPADLVSQIEVIPPLILKQPEKGQSNRLMEGILTVMIMLTVLYLFYVDKEGQ